MEPTFQVTFAGEYQGEYPLSELITVNAEGAPELCDWMRSAKVGEMRVEGGGASPAVITRRVQ